jgi:uncharacterized protein (DUF2252 family)
MKVSAAAAASNALICPTARTAELNAARGLKMARSVHAYVRGNTAKFYEWLAESPVARIIPDGPPIWICGDCHLGNLGPIADGTGRIYFQIRDLDQTVIGNPALDLVRLGLSLETAARSSDLPGVATARMIEAMADGYCRALTPDLADDPSEPDVIRTVRKRAAGRHWRHLARERIDGLKPEIPLGKRFWPLEKIERDEITALFAVPKVQERALALAGLSGEGRLRVLDSAYWQKGCSSLGHLRYAVLVGVREKGSVQDYHALVDIEEAVAPLAPRAPGVKMPRDHGERVVAGARALAPNLGDRMIASRLLGKPVVLRELKPQDLKLEIAQFSRKQAERAAAYLAFVVGRAHARQLTDAQRERWRVAFSKRPDRAIDAPSWLWRAIVDLAGAHESEYLEHCRRYVLGTERRAD